MSFVKTNPNPQGLNVGDCAIRAISIATDKPWNEVYTGVTLVGLKLSDMPTSNRVWGEYLEENGFKLYLIPDSCPECYTIKDFTREYPTGTYIVGTGRHVVAVKDGSYMDTWDSGSERPLYFFKKGDSNV